MIRGDGGGECGNDGRGIHGRRGILDARNEVVLKEGQRMEGKMISENEVSERGFVSNLCDVSLPLSKG